MRFGLDIIDQKVLAEPGALLVKCPQCGELLVPKCGEIVAWHWAHKAGSDCDSWNEGETNWHLRWKGLVRSEFQEVVKGCHRADIVGNRGIVVELQHSQISPQEIREREQYYGNMIWLFDASDFRRNLSIRGRVGDDGGAYKTFRWKHARTSHYECRKPVFWDLGNGDILDVRRLKGERGSFRGGWGLMIDEEGFIERFLSEVMAEEWGMLWP